MQKEDVRLIKRIVSRGDKKAAEELVGAYYREIYAFAYRQTQERESAMDLTQDVFMSVLETLRFYDPSKASFRTWLYHAAANKAVDLYRSAAFRHEVSSDFPFEELPEETADFEAFFETVEKTAETQRALSVLSVEQQKLVRLKVFGGLTFTELSPIFGKPESTLKSAYYAALQKMKKEMMEYAN